MFYISLYTIKYIIIAKINTIFPVSYCLNIAYAMEVVKNVLAVLPAQLLWLSGYPITKRHVIFYCEILE